MIDNSIVQEAFKRIDRIAEKLGTTSEYLWPKLVAWERGRALAILILICLGWLITISGLWASYHHRKSIDDEFLWGFVITPLIIIGITVLIFTFVVATSAISTLFSPEAAAFYKLLNR